MSEPENCIDGTPHNFVYLRQTSAEISWHNWRTDDVYYCSKCLAQRRVEVPKQQEQRRW